MTTTIYANYGVLAHDKQTVFTAVSPADAALSEELTVDIPDECEPYEAIVGTIALKLGGHIYHLGEALASRNDAPALRWCDQYGHTHYMPLRIVER